MVLSQPKKCFRLAVAGSGGSGSRRNNPFMGLPPDIAPLFTIRFGWSVSHMKGICISFEKCSHQNFHIANRGGARGGFMVKMGGYIQMKILTKQAGWAFWVVCHWKGWINLLEMLFNKLSQNVNSGVARRNFQNVKFLDFWTAVSPLFTDRFSKLERLLKALFE